MNEGRPNPPRRNGYAVWRWPWWVWAFFGVISLYFLSAIPVFRWMLFLDVKTWSPLVFWAIWHFYDPVWWAEENIGGVGIFLNWQESTMHMLGL